METARKMRPEKAKGAEGPPPDGDGPCVLGMGMREPETPVVSVEAASLPDAGA